MKIRLKTMIGPEIRESSDSLALMATVYEGELPDWKGDAPEVLTLGAERAFVRQRLEAQMIGGRMVHRYDFLEVPTCAVAAAAEDRAVEAPTVERKVKALAQPKKLTGRKR